MSEFDSDFCLTMKLNFPDSELRDEFIILLLALTRDFSEQHGGFFSADSEED